MMFVFLLVFGKRVNDAKTVVVHAIVASDYYYVHLLDIFNVVIVVVVYVRLI